MRTYTSKAIFDVLKNMYEKWNNRMYTGCIFVDFSKAFETIIINHSILLKKLKFYGFNTPSLNLMENYITTRTQVTTVNGHVSSSKKVFCGTAQGSILGPLIYILYVDDVLSLLDHDNDMYLYADKMDRIYDWCRLSKLTINEAKTKYMIVGSGKVEPMGKLLINNRVLGKVTHY